MRTDWEGIFFSHRYLVLNCCKTKKVPGSTKDKRQVVLCHYAQAAPALVYASRWHEVALVFPCQPLSFQHITFTCPTQLIRPLKIYPRQVKMGAPQSKLQQPVEKLYEALAPSNKTAEVDLLLAGLRNFLSRSLATLPRSRLR